MSGSVTPIRPGVEVGQPAPRLPMSVPARAFRAVITFDGASCGPSVAVDFADRWNGDPAVACVWIEDEFTRATGMPVTVAGGYIEDGS